MLEVIKAFGKLEYEMETDETLTKHHYRVSVHVQRVAELEHIILKNVDDFGCKLVSISLGSLHRSLKLQ
jgi:hypothetical protein